MMLNNFSETVTTAYNGNKNCNNNVQDNSSSKEPAAVLPQRPAVQTIDSMQTSKQPPAAAATAHLTAPPTWGPYGTPHQLDGFLNSCYSTGNHHQSVYTTVDQYKSNPSKYHPSPHPIHPDYHYTAQYTSGTIHHPIPVKCSEVCCQHLSDPPRYSHLNPTAFHPSFPPHHMQPPRYSDYHHTSSNGFTAKQYLCANKKNKSNSSATSSNSGFSSVHSDFHSLPKYGHHHHHHHHHQHQSNSSRQNELKQPTKPVALESHYSVYPGFNSYWASRGWIPPPPTYHQAVKLAQYKTKHDTTSVHCPTAFQAIDHNISTAPNINQERKGVIMNGPNNSTNVSSINSSSSNSNNNNNSSNILGNVSKTVNDYHQKKSVIGSDCFELGTSFINSGYPPIVHNSTNKITINNITTPLPATPPSHSQMNTLPYRIVSGDKQQIVQSELQLDIASADINGQNNASPTHCINVLTSTPHNSNFVINETVNCNPINYSITSNEIYNNSARKANLKSFQNTQNNCTPPTERLSVSNDDCSQQIRTKKAPDLDVRQFLVTWNDADEDNTRLSESQNGGATNVSAERSKSNCDEERHTATATPNDTNNKSNGNVDKSSTWNNDSFLHATQQSMSKNDAAVSMDATVTSNCSNNNHIIFNENSYSKNDSSNINEPTFLPKPYLQNGDKTHVSYVNSFVQDASKVEGGEKVSLENRVHPIEKPHFSFYNNFSDWRMRDDKLKSDASIIENASAFYNPYSEPTSQHPYNAIRQNYTSWDHINHSNNCNNHLRIPSVSVANTIMSGVQKDCFEKKSNVNIVEPIIPARNTSIFQSDQSMDIRKKHFPALSESLVPFYSNSSIANIQQRSVINNSCSFIDLTNTKRDTVNDYTSTGDVIKSNSQQSDQERSYLNCQTGVICENNNSSKCLINSNLKTDDNIVLDRSEELISKSTVGPSNEVEINLDSSSELKNSSLIPSGTDFENAFGDTTSSNISNNDKNENIHAPNKNSDTSNYIDVVSNNTLENLSLDFKNKDHMSDNAAVNLINTCNKYNLNGCPDIVEPVVRSVDSAATTPSPISIDKVNSTGGSSEEVNKNPASLYFIDRNHSNDESLLNTYTSDNHRAGQTNQTDENNDETITLHSASENFSDLNISPLDVNKYTPYDQQYSNMQQSLENKILKSNSAENIDENHLKMFCKNGNKESGNLDNRLNESITSISTNITTATATAITTASTTSSANPIITPAPTITCKDSNSRIIKMKLNKRLKKKLTPSLKLKRVPNSRDWVKIASAVNSKNNNNINYVSGNEYKIDVNIEGSFLTEKENRNIITPSPLQVSSGCSVDIDTNLTSQEKKQMTGVLSMPSLDDSPNSLGSNHCNTEIDNEIEELISVQSDSRHSDNDINDSNGKSYFNTMEKHKELLNQEIYERKTKLNHVHTGSDINVLSVLQFTHSLTKQTTVDDERSKKVLENHNEIEKACKEDDVNCVSDLQDNLNIVSSIENSLDTCHNNNNVNGSVSSLDVRITNKLNINSRISVDHVLINNSSDHSTSEYHCSSFGERLGSIPFSKSPSMAYFKLSGNESFKDHHQDDDVCDYDEERLISSVECTPGSPNVEELFEDINKTTLDNLNKSNFASELKIDTNNEKLVSEDFQSKPNLTESDCLIKNKQESVIKSTSAKSNDNSHHNHHHQVPHNNEKLHNNNNGSNDTFSYHQCCSTNAHDSVSCSSQFNEDEVEPDLLTAGKAVSFDEGNISKPAESNLGDDGIVFGKHSCSDSASDSTINALIAHENQNLKLSSNVNESVPKETEFNFQSSNIVKHSVESDRCNIENNLYMENLCDINNLTSSHCNENCRSFTDSNDKVIYSNVSSDCQSIVTDNLKNIVDLSRETSPLKKVLSDNTFNVSTEFSKDLPNAKPETVMNDLNTAINLSNDISCSVNIVGEMCKEGKQPVVNEESRFKNNDNSDDKTKCATVTTSEDIANEELNTTEIEQLEQTSLVDDITITVGNEKDVKSDIINTESGSQCDKCKIESSALSYDANQSNSSPVVYKGCHSAIDYSTDKEERNDKVVQFYDAEKELKQTSVKKLDEVKNSSLITPESDTKLLKFSDEINDLYKNNICSSVRDCDNFESREVKLESMKEDQQNHFISDICEKLSSNHESRENLNKNISLVECETVKSSNNDVETIEDKTMKNFELSKIDTKTKSLKNICEEKLKSNEDNVNDFESTTRKSVIHDESPNNICITSNEYNPYLNTEIRSSNESFSVNSPSTFTKTAEDSLKDSCSSFDVDDKTLTLDQSEKLLNLKNDNHKVKTTEKPCCDTLYKMCSVGIKPKELEDEKAIDDNCSLIIANDENVCSEIIRDSSGDPDSEKQSFDNSIHCIDKSEDKNQIECGHSIENKTCENAPVIIDSSTTDPDATEIINSKSCQNNSLSELKTENFKHVKNNCNSSVEACINFNESCQSKCDKSSFNSGKVFDNKIYNCSNSNSFIKNVNKRDHEFCTEVCENGEEMNCDELNRGIIQMNQSDNNVKNDSDLSKTKFKVIDCCVDDKVTEVCNSIDAGHDMNRELVDRNKLETSNDKITCLKSKNDDSLTLENTCLKNEVTVAQNEKNDSSIVLCSSFTVNSEEVGNTKLQADSVDNDKKFTSNECDGSVEVIKKGDESIDDDNVNMVKPATSKDLNILKTTTCTSDSVVISPNITEIRVQCEFTPIESTLDFDDPETRNMKNMAQYIDTDNNKSDQTVDHCIKDSVTCREQESVNTSENQKKLIFYKLDDEKINTNNKNTEANVEKNLRDNNCKIFNENNNPKSEEFDFLKPITLNNKSDCDIRDVNDEPHSTEIKISEESRKSPSLNSPQRCCEAILEDNLLALDETVNQNKKSSDILESEEQTLYLSNDHSIVDKEKNLQVTEKNNSCDINEKDDFNEVNTLQNELKKVYSSENINSSKLDCGNCTKFGDVNEEMSEINSVNTDSFESHCSQMKCAAVIDHTLKCTKSRKSKSNSDESIKFCRNSKIFLFKKHLFYKNKIRLRNSCNKVFVKGYKNNLIKSKINKKFLVKRKLHKKNAPQCNSSSQELKFIKNNKKRKTVFKKLYKFGNVNIIESSVKSNNIAEKFNSRNHITQSSLDDSIKELYEEKKDDSTDVALSNDCLNLDESSLSVSEKMILQSNEISESKSDLNEVEDIDNIVNSSERNCDENFIIENQIKNMDDNCVVKREFSKKRKYDDGDKRSLIMNSEKRDSNKKFKKFSKHFLKQNNKKIVNFNDLIIGNKSSQVNQEVSESLEGKIESIICKNLLTEEHVSHTNCSTCENTVRYASSINKRLCLITSDENDKKNQDFIQRFTNHYEEVSELNNNVTSSTEIDSELFSRESFSFRNSYPSNSNYTDSVAKRPCFEMLNNESTNSSSVRIKSNNVENTDEIDDNISTTTDEVEFLKDNQNVVNKSENIEINKEAFCVKRISCDEKNKNLNETESTEVTEYLDYSSEMKSNNLIIMNEKCENSCNDIKVTDDDDDDDNSKMPVINVDNSSRIVIIIEELCNSQDKVDLNLEDKPDSNENNCKDKSPGQISNNLECEEQTIVSFSKNSNEKLLKSNEVHNDEENQFITTVLDDFSVAEIEVGYNGEVGINYQNNDMEQGLHEPCDVNSNNGCNKKNDIACDDTDNDDDDDYYDDHHLCDGVKQQRSVYCEDYISGGGNENSIDYDDDGNNSNCNSSPGRNEFILETVAVEGGKTDTSVTFKPVNDAATSENIFNCNGDNDNNNNINNDESALKFSNENERHFDVISISPTINDDDHNTQLHDADSSKPIIKCSLPWERVFNISHSKKRKVLRKTNTSNNLLNGIELGPAKIELRMGASGTEKSSGEAVWKVIGDNSPVTVNKCISPVVKVKRLILQRDPELTSYSEDSVSSSKESLISSSDEDNSDGKNEEKSCTLSCEEKSCASSSEHSKSTTVPKVLIKKMKQSEYKSFLKLPLKFNEPIVKLIRCNLIDDLALKNKTSISLCNKNDIEIMNESFRKSKQKQSKSIENIHENSTESKKISDLTANENSFNKLKNVSDNNKCNNGSCSGTNGSVSSCNIKSGDNFFYKYSPTPRSQSPSQSTFRTCDNKLENNNIYENPINKHYDTQDLMINCNEFDSEVERINSQKKESDSLSSYSISNNSVDETVKGNGRVSSRGTKRHSDQSVSGINSSAKKRTSKNVSNYMFHCQRCLLVFNNKEEVINHQATLHPTHQELHHCMLCQRSFSSLTRHTMHIQSRSHRRLELLQRCTIHAMHRYFTGRDCPRLYPLTPAELKSFDWRPNQPGCIHFYHHPSPLQLALQENPWGMKSKINNERLSPTSASSSSSPPSSPALMNRPSSSSTPDAISNTSYSHSKSDDGS
ncbi:uncharacterized protein LOC142320799 [Lycorma delicatula]|uniref:uncharacterized protein LOC142320799 n=1 Tax=Lycorma delicatula TaxID=130591 RepID=UPI003F50EF19